MLRGTPAISLDCLNCSPDLSGLPNRKRLFGLRFSTNRSTLAQTSNVAAKGGKYDISPEATAKRRDAQANKPHQLHST